MIKLVVSDLDGTLLSDKHELSCEVERGIGEFTAAGGLFTIATGRSWPAVRDIAQRLSIRLPLILCNGAMLADCQRVYYSSPIQLGGLGDVFAGAAKAGLAVLLFQHTAVYGFGSRKGIERFMEKEKVNCDIIAPRKEELQGMSALKAVMIGDFEKSAGLWRSCGMEDSMAYDVLQSESDFFEIVSHGENKGKAMLALAKLLGVSRQEILAVGNHMNDRDMLKEAGIGAAVSNCWNDLKGHADYLCKSSYGEGVMEAVYKFCNIKQPHSQPIADFRI